MYQIKLPQLTRQHLIGSKPETVTIPITDRFVDGVEDRFFIDGDLQGMMINYPMRDIYKLEFFDQRINWDGDNINDVPWSMIEAEIDMISNNEGNIVEIYYTNGKFTSSSNHTILAYLLLGYKDFPCQLLFDKKIPIAPVQNRINKAIRKFRENL